MSLYTIKKESRSYYIDRGSKFIGILRSLELSSDFKVNLKEIKKQNPTATHVCSAYRIMNLKNIEERCSDDGEPSGSAGQPILNELKRKSIVNAGVFVIRYYGGRQLGVSGLIHSYSEATRLCLLDNKIIEWNFSKEYILVHSYKEIDILDALIAKYEATLVNREFDLFINSYIKINEDYAKLFRDEIISKTSGSISIKELK